MEAPDPRDAKIIELESRLSSAAEVMRSRGLQCTSDVAWETWDVLWDIIVQTMASDAADKFARAFSREPGSCSEAASVVERRGLKLKVEDECILTDAGKAATRDGILYVDEVKNGRK